MFSCLNKELSLRLIFSYLSSLIGGLENERFLNGLLSMANKYIYTFKHI